MSQITMDVQERDRTAIRIQRIREASTEARNKAGLKDVPQDLYSNFSDFDEIVEG